MYKQQRKDKIAIIILSNDIFPFFLNGKIKNAKIKAKPKWMALAGKPFTTPKSSIIGKGDAYQSWKMDHNMAIEVTIFRWNPF